MMLAGVHRGIEIGVAVGSAYPPAIETEAGGGSWAGEKIRVVLKEIDESLTRIGFGEGMLGLLGLHIKFDIVLAASGSGSLLNGCRLGKRRSGKAEEKKRQDGFHVQGSKRGILGRLPRWGYAALI